MALNIGPDGLTLRRALMAAGGVRDVIVSDGHIAAEADVAKKLETLTSQGRKLGEYQFLGLFFRILPETAAQATGLNRETVQQDRKKEEEQSDAEIERLSREFPKGSLEQVRGLSRNVGFTQAKLKYFDSIQDTPLLGDARRA